jgi:hypothetical protein
MALLRELLGERLDRCASPLGKAFELAGLEETVCAYREELNDHATAPGIIEREREFFVSGS